jgi:hypothetical protein
VTGRAPDLVRGCRVLGVYLLETWLGGFFFPYYTRVFNDLFVRANVYT